MQDRFRSFDENAFISQKDGKAGEADRLYAIRSLLQAEEELQQGVFLPLSALDEVDDALAREFRQGLL
jgi:hypothetical protein